MKTYQLGKVFVATDAVRAGARLWRPAASPRPVKLWAALAYLPTLSVAPGRVTLNFVFLSFRPL